MKTVFSSFTAFVDGQTNLPDLIRSMENKLLKSSSTRHQITEKYKQNSNNIEKCSAVSKNYNEIMHAINSQNDLLLNDMEENYDINVQETKQLIKEYSDDISNSYNASFSHTKKIRKSEQISKLELSEYSNNLNTLNNRILRFNLNNIDMSKNKRSKDVENEFSKLSEELDLFTKMVKAQTSLQNGKKRVNKQIDDSSYNFEVIDQLLSKTNEVTFTLSNKNK